MKTVRNKKKIIEETYNWCCDTFGTPLKTKKFPSLEIISRKTDENVGYYEERQIIINSVKCKSVCGLIRVVIHEYTHFLQMPKIRDMKKYADLLETHSYYEHPMEVEAFASELKHFRNCLRYLQRRNIV